MKDKLVWNIGGVEIFAIQEIVDAGELIQSIIPKASKEEVGKIDWLVPNFASETGELKAVVQCFLIKTDNQSILVDTCNGNDKTRTDMPIWGNLETDFLEKLESVTGCRPEDIDVVVNTHLHFDHVGWNTQLVGGEWVPTFRNAEYLFVKDEYEYWLGNPEGEIGDD